MWKEIEYIPYFSDLCQQKVKTEYAHLCLFAVKICDYLTADSFIHRKQLDLQSDEGESEEMYLT